MLTNLLWLTPVWPLLVLLLLLLWPSRSTFSGLWLSAPLPGLLLAILATGDPAASFIELPWLFLGAIWWLDETRQIFLLVSSLLWFAAGFYARGYLGQAKGQDAASLRRFEYLWLLTLAGNLLLIVAEDVASFYAGFVALTFAGYGLVIHFRTPEALLAGRQYLYLALLGEGFILAGLLGTAAQAAGPTLTQLSLVFQAENASALPLMACLLLGFGVKAGLPLLHVWLPVAHPVAPTPASAVLSGALVKAGLLAWILLLPLGRSSWPELAEPLLIAGLVSALGAGLIGALQLKAKAVLAYSTVSQLGMITSLIAVGLMADALWALLLPVILVFVVHHGLNKGALFLAVGVAEKPAGVWRWPLFVLFLLPPLALVGWLTSGTWTKTLMKTLLYQEGWEQLAFWLTLAAISTSLLMARYLWLLLVAQQQSAAVEATQQPTKGASAWMLGGWLLLLITGLSLPWWLPLEGVSLIWPAMQGWIDLAWPVLLALAVAGVAAVATRSSSAWQAWAPPLGDLLVVYMALGCGFLRAFKAFAAQLQRLWHSLQQLPAQGQRLQPLLERLSEWEVSWRREAALAFTLLLVVLAGLLLI